MPRTPASIRLAAPLKASTLGRIGPELGLELPVELAGVVPLLAGNGAALPGAPLLPAALLAEAPEPGVLLPELPLAGTPLLGTLLASCPLSIGFFGTAV